MLADTTKTKKTQEEVESVPPSVDTKASSGKSRTKNAISGNVIVPSMQNMLSVLICDIS
jgi:hypothetical protein